MKRSSTAVWNGTGKEGSGKITSQSTALNEMPYAYGSRFSDKSGTNPEELIAAAHAGCFTMKLSFLLSEKGFTPDELKTTSTVTLEDGSITSSHLVVEGTIKNISAEDFKALAEDAEKNCPVSKVLNAAITMEATLKQ